MDTYTHVARSFFFERPHLSLALLTTQAHIWTPFKIFYLLLSKFLSPITVTTGAAAIGCGVPNCVAALLADYAQWIGPC